MTKQEIVAVIVRIIREVIPDLQDYDIQLDDQLVNLGANSVDRVEIVIMAMEELGLKIPRVQLSVAKNIGELVEVFYENQQVA